MHYSLRQSLMAGASALVLTMGVSAAQAGVTVEDYGAWALVNADQVNGELPETVIGNTSSDLGDDRDNNILNTASPASGILVMQQNSGNNNAVQQATAVTANLVANVDVTNNAIVNSNTIDNDTTHIGGTRDNRIRESFNGFNGQATVQQNNGDHNEIGAATAIYGNANVSIGDVTQNSIAFSNTEDQTTGPNGPITDNGSARNNLINPSFNNSNGVATVQQNNGNGNAMSATTAVTTTNVDAEDVDQFVTANADSDGNRTLDLSVNRTNRILDSFNNANGIITVQENNGDANAMSAATGVIGIGDGPQDGNVDSIDQTVLAEDNDIDDINAADGSRNRANTITRSFNPANGTVTVQQNNGNANQMSAATGVIGITNDVQDDGAEDGIDQEVRANFNDVAEDADITAHDRGGPRTNDITDSFQNAEGVITVQQNNGDANTINAATGVIGVLDDVRGGEDGDVEQNVRSEDARVDDGEGDVVTSAPQGDRRLNSIDPSFTDASGVVTVQQNNGNANTLQSSTGVIGIGGDATSDNVVDDSVEQTVRASDNQINFPEVTDNGGARTNQILNSFDGFSGTASVQQNNGDANSMNIATGVIGIEDDVGDDVEQGNDGVENQDNDVEVDLTVPSSSNRRNTISGSFDGVTGNAVVQQNNGDANSINAATGIVGVGGDVDDDVRQEVNAEQNDVEDGELDDNGSTRNNAITNSFNPANGVTTVQQNNGGGNSMNAATVVAGIGGNVGDDVNQEFGGDQDVDDNDARRLDVTTQNNARRTNTITGSFTNADGVHTVQQNNGDANTINSAVAMVGVEGNIGGDVRQDLDLVDNEIDDIRTEDGRFQNGPNGGSRRTNDITNSFVNADGVITVQQNNGNANTINAGTAVVTAGGQVESVNQEVRVDGDVDDVDTRVTIGGASTTTGNRLNSIDPSFTNANGIITVQQNNGDANVLGAATAVSVTNGFENGDGDVTQLVDVEGRVNRVLNFEDDNGNPRTNRILDSFNNAKGTVTVQQNNGDANVIQAATAHVANVGGRPVDDTRQTVAVRGTVTNATNTDDDSVGRRSNAITNSFKDGGGVATVQQNNGTGNVLGAASAVIVDSGAATFSTGDEDVNSQRVSTSGQVLNSTSDRDTIFAGRNDRNNDINRMSFDRFAGVATVQQNNGDNNVLSAATGVRANNNAADDIDDVAGAAVSTTGRVIRTAYNNVNDPGNDGDANNRITDSFNGARGILTVQQNNGNNNVIGSATGVVANAGTTANPFSSDSVASTAMGSGTVSGNFTRLGPQGVYRNAITNSFNNASAVATIQQNNGHANVMGQATQVTADNDGSFGPAVSVAALGATVSGNVIVQLPGAPNTYSNSISGSFSGASGVITVQQNNGSHNVIGSAISVVTNF